jgi:hypothetical protein
MGKGSGPTQSRGTTLLGQILTLPQAPSSKFDSKALGFCWNAGTLWRDSDNLAKRLAKKGELVTTRGQKEMGFGPVPPQVPDDKESGPKHHL